MFRKCGEEEEKKKKNNTLPEVMEENLI